MFGPDHKEKNIIIVEQCLPLFKDYLYLIFTIHHLTYWMLVLFNLIHICLNIYSIVTMRSDAWMLSLSFLVTWKNVLILSIFVQKVEIHIQKSFSIAVYEMFVWWWDKLPKSAEWVFFSTNITTITLLPLFTKW